MSNWEALGKADAATGTNRSSGNMTTYQWSLYKRGNP